MIPAIYLRLGLFAIGIALGWLINGWRLNGTLNEWWADLAGSQVESIEKARQVEHMSAAVSLETGEQHEQARQVLAGEQTQVAEEVARYEESDSAGNCQLSNRWVRIDTISATGVPEDAAPITGADDGPSGFTDADAINVIQQRNFICRAEIEKLRALQAYVRGQLNLLADQDVKFLETLQRYTALEERGEQGRSE